MKYISIQKIGFWLIAINCLSAVADYPSAIDQHFGESMQKAIADQTVEPASSTTQSQRPVIVDGQAAKASIDRYQKSFETLPATGNVFTDGKK